MCSARCKRGRLDLCNEHAQPYDLQTRFQLLIWGSFNPTKAFALSAEAYLSQTFPASARCLAHSKKRGMIFWVICDLSAFFNLLRVLQTAFALLVLIFFNTKRENVQMAKVAQEPQNNWVGELHEQEGIYTITKKVVFKPGWKIPSCENWTSTSGPKHDCKMAERQLTCQDFNDECSPDEKAHVSDLCRKVERALVKHFVQARSRGYSISATARSVLRTLAECRGGSSTLRSI